MLVNTADIAIVTRVDRTTRHLDHSGTTIHTTHFVITAECPHCSKLQTCEGGGRTGYDNDPRHHPVYACDRCRTRFIVDLDKHGLTLDHGTVVRQSDRA